MPSLLVCLPFLRAASAAETQQPFANSYKELALAGLKCQPEVVMYLPSFKRGRLSKDAARTRV